MDNRENLNLARKRAEEKIGFYIHATVYLLVNLLLIAINLATDQSVLWFIWPLVGWGVGLAGHAALVFGPHRKVSFKDRLIQKELEKIEAGK